MMRPLVEFVQSQQLEWTPVHYGEVRDGVEGKLLSRDETTGAATMLLRFPAGWRASRHYLGTSEELFILDGALDVGADRMEAHSYAFLPAGFQYESMASARGAVALVFYEADAIAHSGVAPVGAMDADRLIRPYDTVTQPWSGLEIDPKIDHLAPKRKDLRIDPDGQYRSYLLGGLPHGMPPEQEGPLETHPHVEEMFCISGDVAGTRGVMYPGAYFWRPPGIEHGANCSRQGFLLFFRVVGAVETTTSWSDTPHPIRLETPYAPYLPADLVALADRPYDGRPVY